MAVARLRVLTRRQQALGGTYNGVNRSFTFPENFKQGSSRIFHNGRRLKIASDGTLLTGEYTETESGGLGAGFNSIYLLSFAPTTGSVLVADYYII